MNSIFLLLKVQLLSFFGFNKLLHKSRFSDRGKQVGALVLMIVCFVFLLGISFLYSFLIGQALVPTGNTELLLTIMNVAASAMILLTSIFKVNGVLVGFKDYDMVMSMPVKTGAIVASRVLLLYIMNIAFTVLIMLPAGIVYAMLENPPAGFYAVFFLGMLFVPLIPILLASVIGTLIAAAASRFRRMNFINIIITFVFLIAVMLFSNNINQLQEYVAVSGDTIGAGISAIYPPAAWLTGAAVGGDVGAGLLFFGVSAALFLVFCVLLGKLFKALNTALLTTKAGSVYKMSALKTATPLRALFKKELKRYFSSSLYVVNTAFSGVLLTILSIGNLVVGSEKIEAMMEFPGMSGLIANYAPMFMSFFVVMSCTTACSISLEGKNFWILKSAPVGVNSIFWSKILVNVAILLPFIVINSVLFAVTLDMNPLAVFMTLALPAAYTFFIAVAGLIVNLHHPQLEWANEAVVVKQSASVVLTMLVGFAGVAVPIVSLFIFRAANVNLVMLGILLAVLLVDFAMYRYLMTSGKRIFNAL